MTHLSRARPCTHAVAAGWQRWFPHAVLIFATSVPSPHRSPRDCPRSALDPDLLAFPSTATCVVMRAGAAATLSRSSRPRRQRQRRDQRIVVTSVYATYSGIVFLHHHRPRPARPSYRAQDRRPIRRTGTRTPSRAGQESRPPAFPATHALAAMMEAALGETFMLRLPSGRQ